MGERLISSSGSFDPVRRSRRRIFLCASLWITATAGLAVAPNGFAQRNDVTPRGEVPIGDTHASGFYRIEPTTYDEKIRAAVGRGDFTAAIALAKEQMQRGAEPKRGELNLAWIYSKRGDWRASSAECRRMLAGGESGRSMSRELLADVYHQLGQCDHHLGDDRAARQHIAKALELRASADKENSFAWLLATSRDGTVRDGRLALQHARQACQASFNPNVIDTLAAAEAESGDFHAAIASEQLAIRLLNKEPGTSSSHGDDRMVKFQKRLIGYQANKPYRVERGD